MIRIVFSAGSLALVFAFAIATACSAGSVDPEPRSLYPFSFGGLENLSVDNSVALLEGFGYSGIAVEARGSAALNRLDQYLQSSDAEGEDFEVVSAFMAHRVDQYGLSDAGHRAAIDVLAGRGGDLWVYVRDDAGTATHGEVVAFFSGIVDYASASGVRVVLYPHYNNIFPTAVDALTLVEEIDDPSFGLAVNLTHELQSEQGDVLAQTFEAVEDRIFAVIISGADATLDTRSNSTRNASTIMSLDDSEYGLRPYMELIASSGYEGPVGFLNFKLPNPEDYLQRTIQRWNELALEVGLHNVTVPEPGSSVLTLIAITCFFSRKNQLCLSPSRAVTPSRNPQLGLVCLPHTPRR